jgi:hypothetical protein
MLGEDGADVGGVIASMERWMQCPRTFYTDLDTLICKILGKDIF